MAGVDHSCQYSVEVKSRFSLFLDDSVNNEDPDLLISKLQSKRSERAKKEKSATVTAQHPVTVPKVAVSEAIAEVPLKPQAVKHVNIAQPAEAPAVHEPEKEQPIQPPPNYPTFTRGRGDGVANRGFRGRGRGFRPPMGRFQESGPDASGDPQGAGAPSFEPRGRGRSRGRFFRGRGAGYMGNRFNGPQQTYDQSEPGPHFDEEPATDVHETVPTENIDLDTALDATTKPDAQPGEAEKDTEQEEEPKTYTLEEYKAMRSSAKPVVALSTKNCRKANDGKDVFVDMVPHQKIDEVSEDEEQSKKVEKPSKPEPTFEYEVSFTDRHGDRGVSPRRGRGRAGPAFRGAVRGRGFPNQRGAFRGDRGRGFTRKPAHDQPAAPVISSDQDFPSLK